MSSFVLGSYWIIRGNDKQAKAERACATARIKGWCPNKSGCRRCPKAEQTKDLRVEHLEVVSPLY